MEINQIPSMQTHEDNCSDVTRLTAILRRFAENCRKEEREHLKNGEVYQVSLVYTQNSTLCYKNWYINAANTLALHN